MWPWNDRDDIVLSRAVFRKCLLRDFPGRIKGCAVKISGSHGGDYEDVFWNVTSCSLLGDIRFRGAYSFRYDRPDGGSTHVWNVGILLCDYTAIYRRFRRAYCLPHQGDHDERSTHVWNVGILLWEYTALYPTKLSCLGFAVVVLVIKCVKSFEIIDSTVDTWNLSLLQTFYSVFKKRPKNKVLTRQLCCNYFFLLRQF
jgi:hypothetical protein